MTNAQKKVFSKNIKDTLISDNYYSNLLTDEGNSIISKYRIKTARNGKFYIQRIAFIFLWLRVSRNFKTKEDAAANLMLTTNIVEYIAGFINSKIKNKLS